MKLATIAEAMETAVSGGYVHIDGYTSDKGEVSKILGHICPNYGAAKEKAIKALRQAIADKDFQSITVTGQCYNDNGTWNARKKSAPMEKYNITFSASEVLEQANQILTDWETPKERTNNEVALTEKGKRGLVINLETGRIEFDLLIEQETYDSKASETAKESLGIVEKVKASEPLTKLKAVIRERFQRKMKTYVLENGKFESISINGIKFASSEIQF
jgi:hypothetical protein